MVDTLFQSKLIMKENSK